MIEKVHQHILDELGQSARTDTIFVITAVIFNLIILAVNSGVAENAVSESAKSSDDFLLIVFIFVDIIVNGIAIAALTTGRNTRNKLLLGMYNMYKDHNVDNYYDITLISNYGKRYILFIAVLTCLAAVAVVVPMFIRFL